MADGISLRYISSTVLKQAAFGAVYKKNLNGRAIADMTIFNEAVVSLPKTAVLRHVFSTTWLGLLWKATLGLRLCRPKIVELFEADVSV